VNDELGVFDEEVEYGGNVTLVELVVGLEVVRVCEVLLEVLLELVVDDSSQSVSVVVDVIIVVIVTGVVEL